MWTTATSQHCVRDLTTHWQRSAHAELDYGPLGPWRPIDLLHAVRSADDLDRRDVLAFALIELARNGHAAADQLLLMAMLPRVVHLTRTSRGLRHLPLRDAQAIALGAMWEAIRVHPIERPRAVLHRLSLDALGIVTRTHADAAPDAEWPTAPDELAELREERDTAPSASTLNDLATLLRWGIEIGTVTREDVRVLAAVDLGTPDDRATLAESLGVAAASLTRRAHRIRSRLREAVGREIELAGRW